MIFKIVFIVILQIFAFQGVVAFDDIIKLIRDIGKAAFTPPGYHSHDSSTDDLGKANENKERPLQKQKPWIFSTVDSRKAYHFAKDVKSMNWYEADNYCGEQGAFLAEPLSRIESDFLRDQANQLPETNWWIGLRQFERCQCTSLEGQTIASFTNPDSLQFHTNNGLNGLGKTTCPNNFFKNCNGMEWRWGLSGEKLSYDYWHTHGGQPNNRNIEHCATMWYKKFNQRWGNWNCNMKDKRRGMEFKPLCQKNIN